MPDEREGKVEKTCHRDLKQKVIYTFTYVRMDNDVALRLKGNPEHTVRNKTYFLFKIFVCTAFRPASNNL